VLGCCATRDGDYDLAAGLAGAHDAIDAAIIDHAPTGAHWWSPVEQRVRDDNRGRLREALGDAEYERAHAAGAQLRVEEAVDLALGRVRSA
jgi:hypothetical protein